MKSANRFIAAVIMVAIILIATSASSFGQSGKVKLNEKAFAYAKELIRQGQVVFDKKNEWGGHRPSSKEENEFMQAHGPIEYAQWHLGIDEAHAEGTKARYKFPFGDFKNLRRSGLLAVKSRARQFGYVDIENAATQLLELLESRKTAAISMEHRRLVRALSGVHSIESVCGSGDCDRRQFAFSDGIRRS